MGVVNVTPDSFSDGGRYLDVADARRPRPRAGGRRSRRARRWRRVDPTGCRARDRGRGAAPGGTGGRRASRPSPAFPSASTPPRQPSPTAALRAGAPRRQRRVGRSSRSRRSSPSPRTRARVTSRCTCSASRARCSDDADVRRRRRGGLRLPRRAPRGRRAPPASRRARWPPIPESASARRSPTTSRCSPRLPALVARVARRWCRYVAEVVPRAAVDRRERRGCDRPGRSARGSHARDRRSGRSTTAHESCGSTTPQPQPGRSGCSM